MTRIDPSTRPVTWPWWLGGFTGPLFAGLLANWFTYALAFGLAFFVCFACASMLIDWRSGRSFRFGRALFASAVGAAVGGLVAFIFQQSFAVAPH